MVGEINRGHHLIVRTQVGVQKQAYIYDNSDQVRNVPWRVETKLIFTVWKRYINCRKSQNLKSYKKLKFGKICALCKFWKDFLSNQNIFKIFIFLAKNLFQPSSLLDQAEKFQI